MKKNDLKNLLTNASRELVGFNLVLFYLERTRTYKFIQLNDKILRRIKLKTKKRVSEEIGPPTVKNDGSVVEHEYIHLQEFIQNSLYGKNGFRLFKVGKRYVWFSKF